MEFTEKQVMELYNFRCLLEQEALRLMLSQKNSMFPLIAKVLEKIEKHACPMMGILTGMTWMSSSTGRRYVLQETCLS